MLLEWHKQQPSPTRINTNLASPGGASSPGVSVAIGASVLPSQTNTTIEEKKSQDIVSDPAHDISFDEKETTRKQVSDDKNGAKLGFHSRPA